MGPQGLKSCGFFGCRGETAEASNFVNDDKAVDPECDDCFKPPIPEDAGENALKGVATTIRDDSIQTVCAVVGQGMICGPLGAFPYEREELTDEHEKVGANWVRSYQIASLFWSWGFLVPRASKVRVCSFTAGTPVLMCDGTLRPIEQVEEGDLVLARDEETGEVACRAVVDPYDNPNRAIIALELRSSDGTIERIETTDNHPFFVVDRGWTRVDELALGDLVPDSDGALLLVSSVSWTGDIATVYNFGVDGFHTYFVGDSGAWVHNCLTSSVGKMAEEFGVSTREIRTAIETLKGNSKFGSGTAKNPDVLVDTKTGDVFIKNPDTGEAAEHIDNIFEYLPETE